MALLTVKDFTDKGYSREHGEHEVAKLVFGADHRTDAKGNPIEQGIGSALQQTSQHRSAVDQEARRNRSVQGWTPPEAAARTAPKPRHARSNKRRPPRQKPEPAEAAAE